MKRPVLGALSGALLGLLFVMASRLLVVTSPLLLFLLWPTRFFMTAFNGVGPFGHMILDTIAIFGSIVVYAAVGYGVGYLLRRRASSQARQGTAQGGKA